MNNLDARVDLGTAAYKVDMLPSPVSRDCVGPGRKPRIHFLSRQFLFSHYGFCFNAAYLLFYQGGEQVELLPGGTDIEVTAQNVHDYVRRYAEYRMIKVAEKALKVCLCVNHLTSLLWFHAKV